jgi:hypothetical protein
MVLLHQEPHLPRSNWGATLLEDVADKDVDVVADADVGKARLHLLPDVHPFSCPLQQEGHQHLK